ncbi:hypothetical protein ACIPWF_05780 [Paenarthrobacter sp. NPDC089989]|uniref:hypothetical protein n=1 Tax=unclassified Paenarthrobacter TaxID=2634190 RepID=UPI0038170FCF
MERSNVDVDDFLALPSSPPALSQLDALIREELAGLERVLWEGPMWGGTEQRIIGYGAISQPRPKGEAVDWFLVGLAAQSRHLSIYVNAAGEGGYLVQSWASELGDVKVGAAAITFKDPSRLHEEALRRLLRRARELAPDAR